MKICPKCYYKNTDDGLFCAACGKLIANRFIPDSINLRKNKMIAKWGLGLGIAGLAFGYIAGGYYVSAVIMGIAALFTGMLFVFFGGLFAGEAALSLIDTNASAVIHKNIESMAVFALAFFIAAIAVNSIGLVLSIIAKAKLKRSKMSVVGIVLNAIIPFLPFFPFFAFLFIPLGAVCCLVVILIKVEKYIAKKKRDTLEKNCSIRGIDNTGDASLCEQRESSFGNPISPLAHLEQYMRQKEKRILVRGVWSLSLFVVGLLISYVVPGIIASLLSTSSNTGATSFMFHSQSFILLSIMVGSLIQLAGIVLAIWNGIALIVIKKPLYSRKNCIIGILCSCLSIILWVVTFLIWS